MIFLILVSLVSINTVGATILTVTTTSSCTDSDGGWVIGTDGTVSFLNSSTSSTATVSDSCSASSLGYSTLKEYHCVDDSNSTCANDGSETCYVESQYYYCDDCTSRNCGDTKTTTYRDSDLGNYSNLRGYTNATTNISNSADGTLVISITGAGSTDACQASTRSSYKNYISERYITSSTSDGSTAYSCSTAWGSTYSCIVATGPDFCGIQCTSDSSCSSSQICGGEVNSSGVRVCTDRLSSSPASSLAPEATEEQGFFAKIWAWITGN